LCQKLFDLSELDIHDLMQMFPGQGLEEDNLVNAVQKLGTKMPVQLFHHPVLGGFNAQFLDPVAADV
jgi:hypothetical protein